MIERYRARHAITDPTEALGLPPDDPDHHVERQALDRALNDIVKRINIIEAGPPAEMTNGIEFD